MLKTSYYESIQDTLTKNIVTTNHYTNYPSHFHKKVEISYIENEMDISDFIYKTNDNCFTIGKYEDYSDYNNPFLLFNRTCDGFNVKTIEKNSYVRYMGLRTKKK